MPDTITTAVPQQTPPQDAILHPAQVYFLSRRLPGIVHLVQYDQSLPYLAVELYEGDKPYAVPDGAAVNIRMAKPVLSTKKVYNPAYGISEDRHTVYIQVTPQMTVVAGCTNPVIEVVVDGGIACTGTLRLEIDPNPVQESDLIDTDEYKTLEEILAEAQAAAQIVEDNEQALQDVHNNLAAIQQAASNAQAAANSAEQAAASAEKAQQEAQKALGFRTFYGGEIIPDANGDLDPSRPMSTPTAASVTIKARGDRIAGLTMAGKTTQAGTGDPSPDNIRPITGVGAYDRFVVFDGSEDELMWFASETEHPHYFVLTFPDDAPNANWYTRVPATNWAKRYAIGVPYENMADFSFQPNVPSIGARRIYLKLSSAQATVADARAYLKQNPLILWYHTPDYATHTGPWYTVVELSQDPYRAVGFELAQPLFDGDTLQVNVPSGCDQMMVLIGTEAWGISGSGATARFYMSLPVRAMNTGNPDNGWGYTIKSDKIPSGPVFNGGTNTAIGIAVGTTMYVRGFGDATTVEEFKSFLASNPLTVFYRSVNYTPDKDIPVALETHQQAVLVLDGTEIIAASTSLGGKRVSVNAGDIPNVPSSTDSTGDILCSHYKPVSRGATDFGTQGISFKTPNQPGFYVVDDRYIGGAGDADVTSFKAYLAAQHSAGTPVTIVYELAAPVEYAHEAQTLIAEPGEDGTFTVTGENTLSVRLKAFQDGGDAATLNGKQWRVFEVAVPASAWTGSGTNYTAAITVNGMTAALNVVACALDSSYVGTAAAEQAMAQWDYLETGAGKVTFHATVKPTAAFGVVLTTVS